MLERNVRKEAKNVEKKTKMLGRTRQKMLEKMLGRKRENIGKKCWEVDKNVRKDPINIVRKIQKCWEKGDKMLGRGQKC